MQITDDMVNRTDSVLSRVRGGIPDETIRLALAAALSAEEPVSSRNDEAGYVEFLNQDVPYVVRDIQGSVAILMDLQTRNVIGYRVYDPDSVFAPPAPMGRGYAAVLLSQLLQNAFFAGRGTSGIVSPEDMEAWQDYDPTGLEAYKRALSALSAQVQDVAAKSLADAYQKYLDASDLYNERLAISKTKAFGTMRVDEEYRAIDDARRAFDKLAIDIAKSALPAAPAKQEG